MISVIIPSKNAENLNASALSVLKFDHSCKVIAVDDGIDHSQISEDLKKHIRLVPGIKTFVYSRNCNQGIVAAGDDDVVLLNDDAKLTSYNGFQSMAKAIQEHPDYGLIGATCYNVGNHNQYPQGIGLRFESKMVCFVCVFIPRSTINKVGLLDERFVGYGYDDDDYCLRVRNAGLKIGIHDFCFVDHTTLKSTYRNNPSGSADMNHNCDLFAKKWEKHPSEV